MLNLPASFVLFDTEYTAWEGSWQRNWTGPGEHKELVQIGAIKVDGATLAETGSIVIFITPKLNPRLSEYFIALTGITQDAVDGSGVDLPSALARFKEWCGGLPAYSYGGDDAIAKENCELVGILYPFPAGQFRDIESFFKSHGILTENYESGTLTEAFGKKSSRTGHDGLNDARTILDALVELNKKVG